MAGKEPQRMRFLAAPRGCQPLISKALIRISRITSLISDSPGRSRSRRTAPYLDPILSANACLVGD
jgi:hypothetical protein